MHQDKDQSIVVVMWSDCVTDLWEKRLPHLREKIEGEELFRYDPSIGNYGFQEGENQDDDDDKLVALIERDEKAPYEPVNEPDENFEEASPKAPIAAGV